MMISKHPRRTSGSLTFSSFRALCARDGSTTLGGALTNEVARLAEGLSWQTRGRVHGRADDHLVTTLRRSGMLYLAFGRKLDTLFLAVFTAVLADAIFWLAHEARQGTPRQVDVRFRLGIYRGIGRMEIFLKYTKGMHISEG
jgi:hypothetical protein